MCINCLDVILLSINDRGMESQEKTLAEYIEWMLGMHCDGLCTDIPEERKALAKMVADFVVIYNF